MALRLLLRLRKLCRRRAAARAIHWKPIDRYVHYLHHKNVSPNPWSGMAMHPLETIVLLSVSTFHWVVPSHPFYFLFDLQHAALGGALSHNGFEGPILDGPWPTSNYFHNLHHRHFERNYGAPYLPLDKWFGTFLAGQLCRVGSKLQEEHQYAKEQEMKWPPAFLLPSDCTG